MKLSDLLTTRGLRQAHIARTLRVSRAAVSRWVRTHDSIPPEHLLRARAAMGLTVAERNGLERSYHDYRAAHPRKPRLSVVAS